MDRNLTDSHLDRSNVLNNAMAMREIEKAMERYLESHNEELVRNGYVVLRGEILQSLKKYFLKRMFPKLMSGTSSGALSWVSSISALS